MAVQNPNAPLLAWQAAFGTPPNTAGTIRAWNDITPRVTSWDCQAGRQYELGQPQTGTGNLKVANKDEALTPSNVTSPWYATSPSSRQAGATTTGASTATSITVTLGKLPLAGSQLVLTAASTGQAVTAPDGWTQVTSVVTAAQNVYVWTRTSDGTEWQVTLTVPAATVLAVGWAEYPGVEFVAAVDQAASASRVASSSASQVTGTTAVTSQPVEYAVYVVVPHGFAAASAPTAPVWSAGTGRASAASSSATSTSNSAVFLADAPLAVVGAQSATATWTHATTDAVGVVLALRGARQLVPWRPLRGWGMWPLTGNILNATNSGWDAGLPDSSTFEGGTVGTWAGNGGGTVANSAVRAHDGTKSLLVTWPTASAGVPSASLWPPPTKTGTVYTLSAWVFVPTGNPAVTLSCNGSTSAASAVTNAWTRLTVTFTATDSIGQVTVTTAAGSTSGQTVSVDSVQLEAAGAASTYTTSGPTIYPIHTGYIERYPGTWTAQGYYGWQALTTVDALAVPPRVTLPDSLGADILQDDPQYAWPLTDSSTTGVGVAVTPATQVLYVAQAGNPTTARPAFGTAGGPGADAMTCVAFTPTTATDFWPLYSQVANGVYSGDVGAGTSAEVWLKTTSLTDMAVLVVIGSGSTGWEIRVNTSGQAYTQVTVNGGSTYDYTITGASSVVNDGAWHHVLVTETAAAGTVTGTLIVDGVVAGTATRTAAQAFQAARFWVGGGYWPTPGAAFTGSVARVGWYRSALTSGRAASHALAGRGFPYDTTGQRITRILAWAGWRGAASIPTTTVAVGLASGLAGRTAADAIQSVTTTENGPLIANPAGGLQLLASGSYYQQTGPKWVFGENNGEYPYDGGFGTDQDPRYLANQVTVTRDGGSAQVASSAASEAMFMPSTLTVSTVHAYDARAASMAAYLVWRYQTVRTRIATLTITPGGNPNLWPVVLGARIGDRVRVMRRPNTGRVYQWDGFIDRISHKVDPKSGTYWSTGLEISPVDPAQAGLIGDATYGLIGSAVIVY